MFLEKIFDDPKEFQRLVKDVDDVIGLAQLFEDKDFVIQRIIDDPKEFKRVFKNDEDLQKADKEFANYHEILGKPKLEEAQRLVDNRHSSSVGYIKDATVGALAGAQFSKILPSDVPRYAGTFFTSQTRDRLAQVREEPHREAAKLTNHDESQKIGLKPK